MAVDWQTILDDKVAALTASYAALNAFMTTNVQSYTVDTGGTRQVVQRAELGSLKNTIRVLEGEIDTLSARLGDGAHGVSRPDNLRPYL